MILRTVTGRRGVYRIVHHGSQTHTSIDLFCRYSGVVSHSLAKRGGVHTSAPYENDHTLPCEVVGWRLGSKTVYRYDRDEVKWSPPRDHYKLSTVTTGRRRELYPGNAKTGD